MAFKDLSFQGNENIISSTAIGDVLIQSDRGIDFILDNDNTGTDNLVRFRNGAKLLFDDSDNSIYTITLEAQTSTENRLLYIPNENGILATRDFVSASISSGQQNLTTDGVPEGANNLYYTGIRFDNSFASKSTDDLPEGLNLYYTDARARNAISVLGDLSYDPINGIISTQGLASSTTDDLVEGSTNLYFTDSRARTAVANDITNSAANTLSSAQFYTDTVVNSSIPTVVSALTNDANYATETYVDTAETDAITTSNAYTDAREVAITTAYEAYTNQAEADAITTANAYTDTRETAITTAYQAYTDAREVAITTAYEVYANQAEADAITTANAYTDTRETAITTAYQAYTDTSVANLVDAAPGTLDTLNELASALGDDPNFATTIANDIGTKVSKSGDTMTGDLTLSGPPTNANHAVTKAYVDSVVSTGTGNLTTDDISEGINLYYTDARVDARIPTNVSSFTNDAGYLTSVGTISYNDLTDTPTIPTVPTNVSAFTNDAGYVTTDTNTTYSDGNGIGQTGTTFYVSAGNGLTQQANGLAMSGSFTGTFTASGDVCAYSDRALKRNIQTIEGALDKVTQMRGVTFLKDGKASSGVIAQEVETVLPEVVNQDQYGMRSVAYGNIVGTLIEAIKEQQVQIEKLQSEIAKIKEK